MCLQHSSSSVIHLCATGTLVRLMRTLVKLIRKKQNARTHKHKLLGNHMAAILPSWFLLNNKISLHAVLLSIFRHECDGASDSYPSSSHCKGWYLIVFVSTLRPSWLSFRMYQTWKVFRSSVLKCIYALSTGHGSHFKPVWEKKIRPATENCTVHWQSPNACIQQPKSRFMGAESLRDQGRSGQRRYAWAWS